MNYKNFNDLRAVTELRNIIDVYVPWTQSAIDPQSLKTIINDIIINERSTIVECGSGISTLYIASLLQQNSFTDRKIYSIEHNEEWLAVLNRYINLLGINSYVELIHAPLYTYKNDFQKISWYDSDILSGTIKDIRIDQLIIDGPPAYKSGIKYSRYPAIPFFKSQLSDEYAIFLDDCGRRAEKRIMKEWSKILGIKFNRISDSNIALGVKGQTFNIS